MRCAPIAPVLVVLLTSCTAPPSTRTTTPTPPFEGTQSTARVESDERSHRQSECDLPAALQDY